jgi:hypothetical protein
MVGFLRRSPLILRKSPSECEVDRKIAQARKHRIIPTHHLTHLHPEVPFKNYAHYAKYLRRTIFEEAL